MSTTRRDFLKTATTAALGTAIAPGTSALRRLSVGGSDAIRIGLIGCGGRGTGAVDDALSSARGRHAGRDGRCVPRSPRRRAATQLREKFGDAHRRAGRSHVHRLRRLPEGPGERRQLHHPGDAARIPADPSRRRGRGRQEHLHREAGRRRRSRHPRGPRRLRAGAGEGTRHRRRHAAPPPDRLRRDDEADPRRRDRRHRVGALLLEPGRALEEGPPAGVERRRVAAPQLALLHLALGRPHRRAARPQHRRRQLGDERAPGQRERDGRAAGADRPGLRPHLRSLRHRLRVRERHAAGQPVPADPGLRQQRHRGAGRHQGHVPHRQQRQVLRSPARRRGSSTGTDNRPYVQEHADFIAASAPASRTTS